MLPEPRPAAAALRPVVHGSIRTEMLAAQGLSPREVVDFSVNTNPLGPPPGVLDAVRSLDAGQIARYADPAARPLRRALSERLGVPVDQIVAGNGSSELIWLVALAYVHPAPAIVLIAGPTFGEYERASRLLGATVLHCDRSPADSFAPSLDQLARRVAADTPRVLWLCNPNNPTSQYAARAEIEALVDACTGAGTLLVVDEAYLAFVDAPESVLDLVASGHVFVLRSMTKDYALAGLRLGYGVGTREMVDLLQRVQPPWSVNAAAQAAGLAALGDQAHLVRAQEEVRTARALLVEGLGALGLGYGHPAANFVLVDVGDAAELCAKMLARGFALRDCTSFGLPNYVRIGIRTRAECTALLNALRDVLSGRIDAASAPTSQAAMEPAR